ncbi:type II secretion system protein [Litoribrevibacter albus]|uniref:Prepilin-type N-terminal cleavage/methylation domain-containing protein n=1 Tax=Litoribrevibacter albus TaxID=1473156 RepID=A0AA37W9H9_9GAMM|nr:type II secretion system protein [Litoribrevibacter albus]GLQ33508.1 hypothetical protein GCM10007876_39880 [Litoribrevibacter albus]
MDEPTDFFRGKLDMTKQQTGFTLIELVMVIVILGILSAFALPRFANLSSDANEAVLQAGFGAAKSASAIVHSAALAGNQTGSTGSVDLEGETIDLVFGYAEAEDIALAAGLVEDFDVTASSATSTTFAPSGAASSGTCSFTYTEATSSAASTVVVVASPSC